MARWRGNFENFTKSLISQLTGFEDGDENFRLCQQFATSNFKYHRFLDVDSHKVTRALDGMRIKLEVHSQTDKAKSFCQLTEEFLGSPIFEDKCGGKTDTHYSVLYLLYLLSEHPTATTYRPLAPHQQHEPVDDFDWCGYLLEGEDVYRGSYAESPILSEDELSDSESDELPRYRPQRDEGTGAGHSVTIATQDTSMLVTHDHDVVEEKGFDWLTKNLVVQYWRGLGSERDVTGDHHCSNLSRDWESYQTRTNPMYCERGRTFMTETQVIREVLWMMSGVCDLFLFRHVGTRFILRDDVRVSHLTNASLESLVQPFCRHGAHVQVLKSFVEEIVSQSCMGNDLTSVPMTYQAFTKTVSQFLQDLQRHLSGLEKKIIKEEETVTLSVVGSELQMWMLKIDLIYSLYISGVAAGAGLPTNSLKASHLLSVLYNTVLEYDSLGEFTPDMLSLLLPMWIETSQPYLQIIGDWINNGQLLDPMNEFVVQRNDSVKSVDENFWENAFVLHMPKSSANSSILSTTIAQFPEHEQVAVATAWAPKFLQPVIKDIVLTGKSMEVLDQLGQLSQVIGTSQGKAQSLYNTFIQSLEQTLGSKSAKTPKEEVTRETTATMTVLTGQIEKQMEVKGVYDPLLRINFEAIFTELKLSSPESKSEKDLRLLRGLKPEDLQPVELLLQKCLYPHVRHRYETVCLELVRILKEKYKLMDYLTAMRKFFLMEAGDTMFDFYTEIFDRMKNMEQWRDVSLLNLVLHEALYLHYPEEANRLTVVVETPKEKEKFPISVTDCIKMAYEVPWPVDLVVSSRCQDIYNQIFSFLLQVKRAKYCLEQIRFYDLEKEDILKSFHLSQYEAKDTTRNSRIHRMQILRFRLLYFVNSLHNHLMTRILHSTGLEFQQDIEESVDLDQIIASHNCYVGKIHERCLLHHKVSFLREAVLKVLNLILSFHRIWDQGVDEISIKIIEDMELEFSRCIQFLASFLNNVIKRGSFPHLESLAFSLITSLEYQGR